MRDNKTIQIGDLAASPGEQVRGFLEIGETATGPIRLPLVMINGKGAGPVLCSDRRGARHGISADRRPDAAPPGSPPG